METEAKTLKHMRERFDILNPKVTYDYINAMYLLPIIPHFKTYWQANFIKNIAITIYYLTNAKKQ